MYRRVTTYIYSYDNGEKICNCGYCRFDICDNQCKVFINVKVPDRYTMGIAEIYLLTKDENSGKITKEMLGKTGGLNGTICYRQICDKDHMAGIIGMNNLKGVLIYNGESLKRAFYCNLKGEEPDIMSLEDEPEENMYINVCDEWDEKEDSDDTTYNENIYDYTAYDDVAYDNAPLNKNTDNKINRSDNNFTDNVVTDKVTTDNVSTDNDTIKNDATDNNETKNYTIDNEIDCIDEIDNKNDIGSESCNTDKKENDKKMTDENKSNADKWQELLFNKFPKVRINFDGENSEAIKMRPHDLVWFPRKYWRFSNNRCLLNGYYNYRYIMLVKGVGDREGNYYLAVPGKNMVNEAITARKQGFNEFVMSKGDLGFWCCKVGQK